MSFALIFKRGIILFLALLLQPLAAEEYYNGLPNVSTRAQCECSSWVVSTDFLAWYASEEVASIWADVITIGFNTSAWKAPSFNFKWDYGFRVGIGRDLVYDQWDTRLSWTWFRTDAKHTIAAQISTHNGPEFDAALLSGDTPESLSARWSLLFDMFDWELGRSYWISKYLSLRPFLGLKGGWIDQSIHVQYFDLTISNVPTTNTGREHLKNNFWGVGPLAGLDTKWAVRKFGCHFFNFFGDFSMATLWGRWKCGDVYENTLFKTTSVNMKNSTLGALMLRGFLGIGWDVDIRLGKAHFATKLGYETQIWLNQLRLPTFQLQRLHHDLTLQGATFNCQFDF
ncbi:MAG TPA: Lpg1974 family pore-forming outer membrane protein [Rhabdochlamydiaceae bacterium]|nr:Lpg1974 family pore-forming outer membrane protein [Rhabdochlamydiaceae bacterium]